MSELTCGLYGYMGAKGMDAEYYNEMFRRVNDKGEKITRFVDTNFGAGNIVAAACTYDVRVSNDFNKNIAFLAGMACQPETRRAVLRELLDMKVSAEVYKECKEALEKQLPMSPAKKAAYIWYIHEFAFNGNGRNYSDCGSMDRVYRRIEKLGAFDGVEIQNKDMVDLLKQEKKNPALMEKTMYYLDPPYLDNHACYENNMSSPEEHERLLETMEGIPNIMISGYDSKLYDDILCKKYGFHKYAMGKKWISMSVVEAGSLRKQKTEYVWTSYEVKGPYKQ